MTAWLRLSKVKVTKRSLTPTTYHVWLCLCQSQSGFLWSHGPRPVPRCRWALGSGGAPPDTGPQSCYVAGNQCQVAGEEPRTPTSWGASSGTNCCKKNNIDGLA